MRVLVKSDTKDVAGEVVEHGLFAFAPGGDMNLNPAVGRMCDR